MENIIIPSECPDELIQRVQELAEEHGVLVIIDSSRNYHKELAAHLVAHPPTIGAMALDYTEEIKKNLPKFSPTVTKEKTRKEAIAEMHAKYKAMADRKKRKVTNKRRGKCQQ